MFGGPYVIASDGGRVASGGTRTSDPRMSHRRRNVTVRDGETRGGSGDLGPSGVSVVRLTKTTVVST